MPPRLFRSGDLASDAIACTGGGVMAGLVTAFAMSAHDASQAIYWVHALLVAAFCGYALLGLAMFVTLARQSRSTSRVKASHAQ